MKDLIVSDGNFDHDVEKELLAAMMEVPFGNSRFQIETFILNDPKPERAYRQALLEISEKYKSLKQAQFRRRKLDVELRRLEKKQAEHDDPFERELAGIEIEEKTFDISQEDKMIHDAIIQLKVYSDFLQTVPKFTREEFETAEPEYWRMRALMQSEMDVAATGRISAGNADMLAKIGLSPHEMGERLRVTVQGVEEATKKQFLASPSTPQK
jgi:hypothetical protein